MSKSQQTWYQKSQQSKILASTDFESNRHLDRCQEADFLRHKDKEKKKVLAKTTSDCAAFGLFWLQLLSLSQQNLCPKTMIFPPQSEPSIDPWPIGAVLDNVLLGPRAVVLLPAQHLEVEDLDDRNPVITS